MLHLDTIRQRNKPKEAPKKAEKAPFFLSLSGEAVGDRASVAETENNAKGATHADEEDESDSKLHKLKSDGSHSFESMFTIIKRR